MLRTSNTPRSHSPSTNQQGHINHTLYAFTSGSGRTFTGRWRGDELFVCNTHFWPPECCHALAAVSLSRKNGQGIPIGDIPFCQPNISSCHMSPSKCNSCWYVVVSSSSVVVYYVRGKSLPSVRGVSPSPTRHVIRVQLYIAHCCPTSLHYWCILVYYPQNRYSQRDNHHHTSTFNERVKWEDGRRGVVIGICCRVWRCDCFALRLNHLFMVIGSRCTLCVQAIANTKYTLALISC